MKPILFNTEMVKAILNGKKTVTRRVVKPQPMCYGTNTTIEPHNNDFFLSAERRWLRCRICGNDPEYSREGSNISHHWNSPYDLGDILYVRETWCSAYDGERYFYRADKHTRREEKQFLDYDDVRWSPSIHMPKEAARIFLRVTDIRVERLQEMPHDAPKKEGIHYCECPDGFTWNSHTTMQDCYINPMGAMKALWNSTVKKSDLETYDWDANPWVWVIEFERISREEAEKEEND